MGHSWILVLSAWTSLPSVVVCKFGPKGTTWACMSTTTMLVVTYCIFWSRNRADKIIFASLNVTLNALINTFSICFSIFLLWKSRSLQFSINVLSLMLWPSFRFYPLRNFWPIPITDLFRVIWPALVGNLAGCNYQNNVTSFFILWKMRDWSAGQI